MSTTIKKFGKLRYDPNNILGRGHFSTVFSGFHVDSDGSIFFPAETSTPVAVKRVEITGLVNESAVRLEEELMKKAGDHPNILKLIHIEMNFRFM